jgi:DNA-binding PadR family transcriptional regulator
MAKELTTTSYAILGLLSLRSWTTYELAEQMQRALGQFWPRAQSGLYEEPKKLVAHGLARAASGTVGRRPRTVYSITPKGRRAIASWVAERGTGAAVVEFEPLVRVFFAEHGTKADLLATLDDVRAWVEQQAAAHIGIPEEYLEGRGRFPERTAWLVLAGMFLTEIQRAVDRWATWATEIVEEWPDDITAAEADRAALEEMLQFNLTLAARGEARRGAARS